MKNLSTLLLFFAACTLNSQAQTSRFDLKDCDSTRQIISIYSGKGTIMLPGCFTPATKEVIAQKYHGQKPDMVYAINDIAQIISVGFTTMDLPTKKEDLPKIKDAFTSIFTKQGFENIRSDIITVNGKEFVVFEYTGIAKGHDDTYNMVYLSDLNGKLITATFNCNDLFRDKWKAMGKEILSSLKIKQ